MFTGVTFNNSPVNISINFQSNATPKGGPHQRATLRNERKTVKMVTSKLFRPIYRKSLLRNFSLNHYIEKFTA